MSARRRRFCVFTSHTVAEPRAVRHAHALALAYPDAQIVFVDAAPRGAVPALPVRLSRHGNVERRPYEFWHRRASRLRTATDRLHCAASRAISLATGRPSLDACSPKARGLLNRVWSVAPHADLYIGHNMEALPVLIELRERCGAPIIFDSMEYHADMGPEQSESERAIVQWWLRTSLRQCTLVLASSSMVAAALRSEYGVDSVLALDNVPLRVDALPAGIKRPGFHLYWRNSVVATGPRGLQDALVAMQYLPPDVRLHLQGHLADATALRTELQRRNIEARVEVHPPYAAGDAVLSAAPYGVGLCLEHDVCRNHRLTVSNKLFDYFMAELAVVVSDLPGLRSVVERASGGILYRPGDVQALAAAIRSLYDDPTRAAELARDNRRFALAEGNEQVVMEQFHAAVASVLERTAVE
jgi:glycosyltransferase involved in cell wall biosynthesis